MFGGGATTFSFGGGTTTAPGGFGFGGTTPQSPAPSSGGFGFGTQTTTAPSTGGFGFGTQTPSTPSTTGGFGFGTQTPSTPSTTGGFGFGTQTPSTPSTTTGGFGFGTQTPATPSTGLGGLGGGGGGGFGFGGTQPTTTTTGLGLGGGGFGFGSQTPATPAGGGTSNPFSFNTTGGLIGGGTQMTPSTTGAGGASNPFSFNTTGGGLGGGLTGGLGGLGGGGLSGLGGLGGGLGAGLGTGGTSNVWGGLGAAAAATPVVGASNTLIPSNVSAVTSQTSYSELSANDKQTITELYNQFDKERKICQDIESHSTETLKGVAEDVKLLLECVDRIKTTVEIEQKEASKMKDAVRQASRNAELAVRTLERLNAPINFQQEKSMPSTYFWNLLTEFEQRMQEIRCHIEEIEYLQCSADRHRRAFTPQLLQDVIKNQHEFLLAMAAKVALLHEKVVAQKELFLSTRGRGDDPFAALAEKKKRDLQRDLLLHTPASTPSAPAPTTAPPQTSSLFGFTTPSSTSTPASNPWSSPAPSTTNPVSTPSSTSLFGFSSTPTTPAPTSTPSSTSNPFSFNTPSTTSGLFGATSSTPAPSTPATGGFGATTPLSTGMFGFGAPTAAQPTQAPGTPFTLQASTNQLATSTGARQKKGSGRRSASKS